MIVGIAVLVMVISIETRTITSRHAAVMNFRARASGRGTSTGGLMTGACASGAAMTGFPCARACSSPCSGETCKSELIDPHVRTSARRWQSERFYRARVDDEPILG